MEQPLLAQVNASTNREGEEEEEAEVELDEGGSENQKKKKILKDELYAWCMIMFPLTITLLSRTSMSLTDVAFLGKWDSNYLSSSGIATTWCSLSYVVVSQGALQPIVNLCAQAYGAKQYQLVGIWFQIGCFVGLFCNIFVAILWIWGGTIYQPLAGYDDEERDRVNTFCRYLAIGLPFMTVYIALTNYMVAIGVTRSSLVTNFVGALVNVLLNYLFLYVSPKEFYGSPLATSITRVILCMVLIAHVYFTGAHHQTWGPFSWNDVFNRSRLWVYISQAIPEAISSALEDWQLQTVSTFAARLGSLEVSTHNAIFAIFWVLSSFMWAISNATSVRIGKHLGSGDVPMAKLVLKFASFIAAIFGLIVAFLFVGGRNYVGHIYSNDPEVWRLSKEVSILVGCGYFALAAFYVCMATLGAQGRPAFIAVAFFVGAWLVGVPSSYVFAFEVSATKGLLGLWVGMTLGYGVVTFIAFYGVWRSDWVDIVRVIHERQELLASTSAIAAVGDATLSSPILQNSSSSTSRRVLVVEDSTNDQIVETF